jgi:hypothetical protein
MAKFRFIANKDVVLEFLDEVDIRGLRAHPEYEEIDEKGKVIGAPKSDQRPAWDIPMKAHGARPSIK